MSLPSIFNLLTTKHLSRSKNLDKPVATGNDLLVALSILYFDKVNCPASTEQCVLNIGYAQIVSKTDIEKPLFYAFHDQNKTVSTYGVGINAGNWLGIQGSVSFGMSGFDYLLTGQNSPFDINGSFQITPWFSVNGSVGLGGIGIGFSYIDNNDVSHDFTFNITLKGIAIGLLAGLAFFGISVPIPM